MNAKQVVAAAIAVGLTGCVVNGAPRQTVDVGETPVCHTEVGCAAGWDAARRWVLDKATLKLETYAPDYMATYQPYNANPYVFAARVSREVKPDGTRIVGEVWCGAEAAGGSDGLLLHVKPQPCQPDSTVARRSFNHDVAVAIATVELKR